LQESTEIQSNIKKARCKVLYSGALINQKISVIKFTGTPDNIKSINNNFLPECCFIEKEESGLFYLNIVLSHINPPR
jgi:hypothetical protein